MPNPGAGFFGKLPCAGDFVQRRLPSSFVDVWDRHFENAVAESRHELGDAWHEAYHASPVWRFLLTPGVCGEMAWLGIMGPGVDRVGRCFPMVIATPLAATVAFAPRLFTDVGAWLDAAEQIHSAAQADARVSVEAFDDRVAGLGEPLTQRTSATGSLREVDWASASHWRLPWPPALSAESFLDELGERLRQAPGPWSLWWTAGSGRVPGCVLAAQGLPATTAYVSLLDADRGRASWQTPQAFAFVPARLTTSTQTVQSQADDVLDVAPAVAAWAASSSSVSAPAWLPDAPGLLSDLVSTPEAPVQAAPRLPAAAVPAPQKVVAAPAGADAAARFAIVSRADCALTVLCAEVGVVDTRQRAVAAISQIIRTLARSELSAGLQSLRGQLLMLNPALRQASEDLIDPVLEDCAVLAALVTNGQAGLLRIGSACAWHWRHGRAQPLFAQARCDLPSAPAADEFNDLLFSSPSSALPGLGAAPQPACDEVWCDAIPGDRLLLMAGSSLLHLSPEALGSHLAMPDVDDARRGLADAAGLGMDAARWPLTIIEIGT